ncbi:MAG TPA: hypothetical protein VM406_16490 [Noviherbaspirillum sp.]|nr:hypothetical protein [Noviherbaspirillum sp.]
MTKDIDLDALQAQAEVARKEADGWDEQAYPGPWQTMREQSDAILSLIARIRELESRAAPESAGAWQPKFEAIAHEQEQLAIKFCTEIATSRPDPVRLIEMAEALYLAERNDPVIGAIRADGKEGEQACG